VVPSEKPAVAAYVALLLSATDPGPVIASVVSAFVAPLSQSGGAPDTARSTLDDPWVARTRHGTRARFSRLAFQRPLFSTLTVPITEPVAALATVTAAPRAAVPAT
jgi:hypothetical protein